MAAAAKRPPGGSTTRSTLQRRRQVTGTDNAREITQPALAASAICWNCSALMPGHLGA
jgi:hypothetical protein